MPEWSGDGPLLGHRLLIVFSHGRRELPVVFFCKGTNSIHEGSTLMT